MIAVFVIAPLLFAFGISFTDWPLIGDVAPAGLTNYVSIGSDAGFLRAIGYTLLYTAIVTLPILVLGYVLAVLVRGRRRGRPAWCRSAGSPPRQRITSGRRGRDAAAEHAGHGRDQVRTPGPEHEGSPDCANFLLLINTGFSLFSSPA